MNKAFLIFQWRKATFTIWKDSQYIWSDEGRIATMHLPSAKHIDLTSKNLKFKMELIYE